MSDVNPVDSGLPVFAPSVILLMCSTLCCARTRWWRPLSAVRTGRTGM